MMRVMRKFLRRSVSRYAHDRYSAPTGGGICRVFVARVAFWRLFFNISRHRTSKRVGFVLVRLVLLWLDLSCTRRVGLRAANWNISVGILVGRVSLSSSSFSFLFCRAVLSSLVFG